MANRKVLVVDDEPEIVSVITKLFRSKGYEVATAGNGVQAIQVAIKERPDLLILDISMPEGDGHYVAKQMSKLPETCSIPIIFLTAHSSRRDFQLAYDEGVSRYFTKPFKHDELLLAAEQLVQNHLRNIGKGESRWQRKY